MFEEVAWNLLLFFIGMWVGFEVRVSLNTPGKDDDDSHE